MKTEQKYTDGVYTAIIHEARYGDTTPNTQGKLKFNTISELLDWFADQNPDKSQVRFLLERIDVFIPTSSWGSVYRYALKEVSTNEGIVYRQKTMRTDGPIPFHISESVKNEILDYKQKFEEKKPLVL